jgi:hypothetical protein
MSVKPSESEAEYFARLEVERRKHALAAQERRAAEEERQRLFAWRGTTVRSVLPHW